MAQEKMRIGYARVSTEDQMLDLQLDALTKAGCDRIFHDHGVSGAARKRAVLRTRSRPSSLAMCWWSGSSTV
jgi:DNA invertase Pin-like site-specific DNA recombinase